MENIEELKQEVSDLKKKYRDALGSGNKKEIDSVRKEYTIAMEEYRTALKPKFGEETGIPTVNDSELERWKGKQPSKKYSEKPKKHHEQESKEERPVKDLGDRYGGTLSQEDQDALDAWKKKAGKSRACVEMRSSDRGKAYHGSISTEDWKKKVKKQCSK